LKDGTKFGSQDHVMAGSAKEMSLAAMASGTGRRLLKGQVKHKMDRVFKPGCLDGDWLRIGAIRNAPKHGGTRLRPGPACEAAKR
jgi:hypothetical protein